MKSLKAAAVVAGSLVLAGAATPAFAADLQPAGLDAGVEQLLTRGPGDMMPLRHQNNTLDTESKNSLLHTVNGATDTLNSPGGLLGGLPLRG